MAGEVTPQSGDVGGNNAGVVDRLLIGSACRFGGGLRRRGGSAVGRRCARGCGGDDGEITRELAAGVGFGDPAVTVRADPAIDRVDRPATRPVLPSEVVETRCWDRLGL